MGADIEAPWTMLARTRLDNGRGEVQMAPSLAG